MSYLPEIPTRLAVFRWLEALVARYGDIPPYSELRRGVGIGGEVVHVVAQQGIFKPRGLQYPLSIKTSTGGPYADAFADEHLLEYKYRGTDPQHPDNRGLREAMRRQIPLVYFFGVGKGRYIPLWPVYIVGDHPERLSVTVAADDLGAVSEAANQPVVAAEVLAEGAPERELHRRYVTSTARRRLHQAGFRERVVRAYQRQCAVCNLRHEELLEAAHIIPDSDVRGEPVVSNGLSLCNIHHAAYDRSILAITPDYVTEIRGDVLEEIDGPMLRYGLQEMHGRRILVPRDPRLRPDRNRLEERYSGFLR